MARFLLLTLALMVLNACGKVDPPKTVAAPTEVAWVKPVNADMKPIFDSAKAQNKPLFVYWGAVWCPPCNQVKATVFNRPDFIARSQAFVPVYVDGDSPGAQKIGAQFKVRGYPTMILFSPDGSELTRVPGEIDVRKYLEVLDLALQAPMSVKASLALFSQGQPDKLTAKAWRQLAYYAWEQDQAQLVSADKLVKTLRDLAQGCPVQESEAANRLFLKSLVVTAMESEAQPEPDKQVDRMLSLLKDPRLTRESADVIGNYAVDIVKLITPKAGPKRDELIAALNKALEGFAQDQTLTRADRLGSFGTRLSLAKHVNAEAIDAGLKEQVRQAAKAADREITDIHERQALIPTAAHMLGQAGFVDESDAMLKAELPKAVAPYYHMLVLASNAKARGDKSESVDWAEKAWQGAQGPATRLQWGAGYVTRLIDVTPKDVQRIEAAAAGVIADLQPSAETFYHRNRRSLERMGQKLQAWATAQKQAQLVQKLQTQLNGICAQLPDGEESTASCREVFKKSS